jgi:hypothetical protein
VSRFSKRSLSFRFSHQIPVCISFISCVPHASHYHLLTLGMRGEESSSVSALICVATQCCYSVLF